jgi:hypothetical protein
MSGVYLRHFQRDELLFDQQQSFTILRYFGVEPGIQAAALTDEDRGFAQALLVEAIDASYELGYVNIIFDVFYMKPPVSFDKVQIMTQEFLKKVAEHWFKHATRADLRQPKIYERVRQLLQGHARTVWAIRQATEGQITY